MNLHSNWLVFPLGSAFFAALTAVLGKFGVAGLNSNLATLIRTLVILAVTAAIISWRGEWRRQHRHHHVLIELPDPVAQTAAVSVSGVCHEAC